MSREVTSGPTDALVIHNPVAGTRHADRLRARISARLAEVGVRAEVWTTDSAEAARELARRAVGEGIPRILVAGGDGTISKVAAELLGHRTVLGVLPCGTGNQLAFYLRLPLGLQSALAVALGPSVRTIDVGLVDGRAFTAMAGAGIDAEVIAGADRRAKRWVGAFAYVASGLGAALKTQPSTIRLRVDGKDWEGKGLGVLLANIPRLRVPVLRRGLTVAPEGSAEDGALDGCVLTVENPAELAREVWQGLFQEDGRASNLRYFRGRTIRVEADPPVPVEADGDLIGRTPIDVTLQPRALRVAAPSADEVGDRSSRDG